ncbi:MAG: hypothetical protein WKF35_10865 [Ferruginibacter sp.]
MLRILVLLFSVFLFSCKRNKVNEPLLNNAVTESTKESFFPVSNYIKGQLIEIKNGGINPVKYITVNDHTDSSWIKMEELSKETAPFLEDNIDTANLVSFFSEKKFLDQTLNAYTFTYDPIGKLPDNISLRHWDVYVDPVSNRVKRIYIIKSKGDHTTQLTWQSDEWCKIVFIVTDKNGKSSVEKDVLIKWDF